MVRHSGISTGVICKPEPKKARTLPHSRAGSRHYADFVQFKEDAILFVLKTMPQARKYEKDFFRDNDFDVPDGIIERWIDR